MRPGSGSGAPSAAYDTVKATNALARAVGTVLYHEHDASWHGVLHTSWFEDVSRNFYTSHSIPLQMQRDERCPSGSFFWLGQS